MPKTVEKKDYKSAVGTFTGKIEGALKGENPSEAIKKAVWDMLGDMGIEIKKNEK
ncbi:MAG: hypothetical protein M1130_05900 [Actinobacteria bacterium]|nr:hypothetical protein [Actinomycetota bacterium]